MEITSTLSRGRQGVGKKGKGKREEKEFNIEKAIGTLSAELSGAPALSSSAGALPADYLIALDCSEEQLLPY